MAATIRTLRATAFGALLVTTTALTAPAFAQTSTPAHRAVDANGVDLISGTFPFNFAEGSIGSGEGMLSLERSGTGPDGIANWAATYLYQTISGSVTTVVIVLGDRSERFTKTGSGAFVSAQANGATLTDGFLYTAPDGTTIGFGPGVDDQNGASNLCGHGGANQANCYALPGAVTRPNQAETAFGWEMRSDCATVFNPDGGLDCTYFWRLDTVSNSFGYAIDFSYVANGGSPTGDWYKRNGATLSNGSTTRTVSYNFVSSTVTEITDANGRTWRLTTGTNSIGIRRPGSSADDVSVSLSGGIVTQVIRDGLTTGYSRSVNGNNATTTITQIDGDSGTTDPQTVVVADTSIARVTQITDPLSRVTGYTYDSNGRLTRVTAPEGNYVNYTYDSRGNVTETRAVAKSGTGLPDMITSATYTSTCGEYACNQPLTTTDARGNVTEYDYDEEHGGLLSVTAPAPGGSGDRPQVRYVYGPAFGTSGPLVLTAVSTCATGTATSCVDTANESRTMLGYDSDGNVNSVTRRSGNTSGTGAVTATTTATYDNFGNVLTVDGPLSGTADTVRYRYNTVGEPIGTVAPDPDGTGSLTHIATRLAYDSAGRVSSVERGNVASQSDTDWTNFTASQSVEQVYASNRPIVQRLISGSTTHSLTQTSYDSLGRVQCVAQRMNPAEFGASSLPSDACTLDTEGTGGNAFGPDRIARRYYDAAGQVTEVHTAYGVTNQVAVEASMTYRSNGQVATLTDAEGNMTTYEYDGHDRIRNLRYPSPTTDGVSAPTSGTGADYEQLTYLTATVGGSSRSTPLVAGRRLRDGESLAFSYDTLGRLSGIDRPEMSGAYGEPRDSFYGYDLLGRMTSATHATSGGYWTSAWNLSFSYDALGRLVSRTDPLGTASYGYDAASRRTSLTYPGSGLIAGYSYDAASNLTEIRENPAGSNVLLATYAYDSLGRRTGLTRGNGATTSWSYDAVSRLSQIVQNPGGTSYDVTLDYSYNPAGQIVSTVRNNDAYAWGGHYQVNRNYTANGLNQYTASGSVTPTYDARGNLTGDGTRTFGYVSDNSLVSAYPHTLVYDPVGRLIQTDVTGFVIERYAYDGDQLIAEYDVNNDVTRRYVFGPGLDEPLVWYEGSGTSTRRYFHADERGSVTAVTDSSGNLVGSTPNRYDEYGIPQGALTGRFGYTGQAWLPSAGLYYYRNRIYSPTMGRFMQTDPIGVAGGINIYAYVLNDPVNFTDPLGLLMSCGRTRGAAIITWHEDDEGQHVGVQATWNQVCWDSTAPTGWSPWQIWGDFGSSPPSSPPETETCRQIREAAEAGRVHLRDSITNTDRWDRPDLLVNDRTTAWLNEADARDLRSGIQIIAGSSAIGAARGGARPGFRATAAAFVAGLLGDRFLASRERMYHNQAAAIQARMRQLQAQADGTCPRSR